MKNKRSGLRSTDYLTGLAVTYGVISVMMNIFCMKSLSFGSPIIICDAGLMVSWGVFLTSNVIVEVWDAKTSDRVATFTAIISFVIMCIGRLIVAIPTLPDYADQAAAFAQVFSNGPRTIIASVIAFWTGNYINAHTIANMKERILKKREDNHFLFFIRAAFSTLIGQLADNSIFMLLAFAPVGLSVYEMSLFDIMTAVLSGTIIELVVESCFVPFITIPLTKHIQKIKKEEEKK